MNSVAAEIYTKLGIEAVEEWTELEKRYRQLRQKCEQANTEDDRDVALRKLHECCIRLDLLERNAGIKAGERTT